jgi:2-isopropylmalate synthase
MTAPEQVRIFDTTLRDGEQAPGCTMTLPEKLQVATQLARLRVAVIEAGFPASSPGEQESVCAIAEQVGAMDGPTICGLARAAAGDIEACAAAVRPAFHRRIHTFLATSDIHLQHKLRMTREAVLRRVAESVTYARTFVQDVEFSPEDASRSDLGFLREVLQAATEAGAATLNVPDTVGYAMPEEYAALIAVALDVAAGREGVVVSAHCHDDLGFAVANSLAAVRAGARQVECTVNGIGERAGNAALEEVVMALTTRANYYHVDPGVDTREIARTSRLVSACTGVYVPPNKAVVGANAFAHEAGIHQDGVIKHRATYEIMQAEAVGLESNALVLGKHSGRRALRHRLQAMGYEPDAEEFLRIFERFKELADRKKVIDERDLAVLASGSAEQPVSPWELKDVQVTSGLRNIPTATVRLRGPDGILTESATGTGPVDAVCNAIDKLIGEVGKLSEYQVHGVTDGTEAVGRVIVRVADFHSGHRFVGHGAHTDILTASAEAYVAALNRLLGGRSRRRPSDAALATSA